ncbi:MAG: hypothetical protein A3H97_08885 [Acidobacteria bacterium RIFCSPLOWO2_02_FULL_65_29]|nr:MAG: hypothetical protein A3H97_08885 [Acidobacteria bacterium RIFCSPLOWO2_02_FULL_65_29]
MQILRNMLPNDGTVAAHRIPRACERRNVALPARLTWKDARGSTRFASVMTRDVSELGVFVECQSAVVIPLYRLVQFQFERDVRESDPLPASLRKGRVLGAVYRLSSATAAGGRQGLALRLMVEPKQWPADIEQARATA